MFDSDQAAKVQLTYRSYCTCRRSIQGGPKK